jgi:hypothetical protein
LLVQLLGDRFAEALDLSDRAQIGARGVLLDVYYVRLAARTLGKDVRTYPPEDGLVTYIPVAPTKNLLRLVLTLRGPVLEAWPGEFGRPHLDLGHRQGLLLERLHHADRAVDAFWFSIEHGM